MIYNDFHGCKLSGLGLGCMRFPLMGEKESDIDVAAVSHLVDHAIKNGINYFDTAYRYHAGASETVMGDILSQYPRESFYLATKFPGFEPELMQRVVEIFNDQLNKCKVDYFDFYLFHNICEKNIDAYITDEYGVYAHILKQKKEGKIRHLGFSTHGSIATIKRFLDAYAQELEFCQIQLNYLDWNLQNAKAKVELIRSYGLSVWVMEPVRGGKLAKLDSCDEEMLRRMRPDESIPAWAFRFLQGLDGIGMILSGMSNMEQLEDNIATFTERKPLNSEEIEAILNIADKIIQKNQVPCTACSYCVERCPNDIQIPEVIKRYNENAAPCEPGPTDCIGCRNCEIVCPQGIMISEIMDKFKNRL